MKTTRSAVIAAIFALSAAGFAQVINNPGIDNGFAIPRRNSGNSSRSRSTPTSTNNMGSRTNNNTTGNSANANNNNLTNARPPATGSGSSTTRTTPTPRSSGYTRTTSSNTRSTTGSATGSRPGSGTANASRPKPGGSTGTGATATGAQWNGQVKQVTKGLVDAMKTQRVQFDEETMSEQPGIIILNSRKYQPDPDDSKASKSPDSLVSRPL